MNTFFKVLCLVVCIIAAFKAGREWDEQPGDAFMAIVLAVSVAGLSLVL